ncbi:aspartate/glutamate racemase family protein [Albimonas sp. CAU 1670]|uniref:aspartate/glutamate racemase family protein n=1 Tax=Albimonas sp. CAU 1670 TaxID=3032599 RepID=UPI0023DB9669|nr:aspartate/glutamate racemase family protein [Albimonas sp. CAU 1670]MDF2231816.1 aspartate/glutamate racemase family protein [Albimonas sp. CAU 1670]
MKILLVNPNMTQAMTDRLTEVARRAVAPGTEILPLTAPRGFPYISSRAEAQIAGAVALEMIAPHAKTVDAVVIAAFGDPGLDAARELFDLPVTGMAEASMLAACQLGRRFGVVTFAPWLKPWYHASVRDLGLEARFAGLRSAEDIDGPVTDVAANMRGILKTLAEKVAREDEADAVIFGGAPLAGLAAELALELPCVPIDPISAAVTQAEALVRLSPRGADRGAYARPPAKPSQGLDPTLAAWIARET